MNPTGNTILITGGTSGIGLELAREFQALGNSVIIAGRRRQLIDAAVAANPGMTGYVLDVADPQAIEAFAAAVTAAHPALDMLINNAGIMKVEDLTGGPGYLADAEATVATNLLGPIRLTAALLPHFRTRPRSTIVNVSSGLAFVPLIATPTYNATKAALHSYSIALRHQLSDTTTEVIELVPPSVQTDLMPGHAEDAHALPLADFIAETMALFQRQPTPPEICVERVKFLRNAEAEGRFEQTLALVNAEA